jgi:hypothetical protein
MYDTETAARYLKEFLAERKGAQASGQSVESAETLTLGGILYYDSPEAKATADVFLQNFKVDCIESSKLLGPGTRPADLEEADGKSPLREGVIGAAKTLIGGSEANAVLFVGHQPAVGWLASALVRDAMPVVQSEILCVDLDAKGKPTLSWCISPSDDTALTALQEKIKSKMALANVLSGFLTAGIGVFLALLADKEKIGALGVQAAVVFVAAACLVLAVFLYLRTMFSYDTLLMPVRFWAETASGSGRPSWIVARPPSGAPWILYQNMLRIWRTQFMRATFLTLSGLFLLWSAVFWATWDISHSPYWGQTAWARVFSLAPPTIALLVIAWIKTTEIGKKFVRRFRYRSGPWLGSED